MGEAFSKHDRWAEEFQIDVSLRKTLQSREAEDYLEKLAQAPAEPVKASPEALPKEPVVAYFDDRLARLHEIVAGLWQELDTRLKGST